MQNLLLSGTVLLQLENTLKIDLAFECHSAIEICALLTSVRR